MWVLGDPVIDGEVTGPALIGTAAFIEKGARVQDTVVGAGARVARGAEVRGSVLLPGCAVHAGAVVDGSIVGEGAVVGAGAHLSGLTVVGPGVTVDDDVLLYDVRLPVGG